MFGHICFRAWYPSFYGKEVLGDISGNIVNGGAKTSAGAASESGLFQVLGPGYTVA
jgi:hypothetical protein